MSGRGRRRRHPGGLTRGSDSGRQRLREGEAAAAAEAATARREADTLEPLFSARRWTFLQRERDRSSSSVLGTTTDRLGLRYSVKVEKYLCRLVNSLCRVVNFPESPRKKVHKSTQSVHNFTQSVYVTSVLLTIIPDFTLKNNRLCMKYRFIQEIILKKASNEKDTKKLENKENTEWLQSDRLFCHLNTLDHWQPLQTFDYLLTSVTTSESLLT